MEPDGILWIEHLPLPTPVLNVTVSFYDLLVASAGSGQQQAPVVTVVDQQQPAPPSSRKGKSKGDSDKPALTYYQKGCIEDCSWLVHHQINLPGTVLAGGDGLTVGPAAVPSEESQGWAVFQEACKSTDSTFYLVSPVPYQAAQKHFPAQQALAQDFLNFCISRQAGARYLEHASSRKKIESAFHT
jgi:hypothetical protein